VASCLLTSNKLTVNNLFVCIAMFGIDHQTMQSSKSPGRVLMGEMDIALKEFARNQVFNPFRFLMFWNKEVIRGKVAANTIERSQQDLLNKYRCEKSPAEIEKDQSILGHLVRSPYASDKERCADMTTLIIAGHDTSSYTLAWILLEISRHPAVLTKVKKEIDSAVVDGKEHISQRQLNSMVYLDQVIKEGMRLWPVAGLGVLRQNSKDIQYEDFVIPKGSICQLCFYLINRVGIKVKSLLAQYGHYRKTLLVSSCSSP
jgi:cytochrome P450